MNKKWKPGALRLINAAEKLIAQRGVNEVSLVQIARAAGHANKYAVQYHFGNKDALIRAIFEERLSRISSRRQVLLDQIVTAGDVTVRNLLVALFRPVFEEVNSEGKHSYALFTQRVMEYPETHRLWDVSVGIVTGERVNDMLAELLPDLSPDDFEMRILLAVEYFYSAMSFIDRNLIPSSPAYASRFPADLISADAILTGFIESAAKILERTKILEITDITG